MLVGFLAVAGFFAAVVAFFAPVVVFFAAAGDFVAVLAVEVRRARGEGAAARPPGDSGEDHDRGEEAGRGEEGGHDGQEDNGRRGQARRREEDDDPHQEKFRNLTKTASR